LSMPQYPSGLSQPQREYEPFAVVVPQTPERAFWHANELTATGH
jgi:hypothetical protein